MADPLATLLHEAIDSLDDEADTHRIWRAMSGERLADILAARLSERGVTLTQPQPVAGSLRRWAVHSPFCAWTEHGLPCSCGLDAALRSTPAAPTLTSEDWHDIGVGLAERGVPIPGLPAPSTPAAPLDVERLGRALDKYVMPLRGLDIPVAAIAREYAALAPKEANR